MTALSRCDELANPEIGNFVLSLLILLGILISYVPQQIRIISRRSTEGLSPWFILLGTVAGTCAISNILMLPNSREDIACCKELSSLACTADLLGVFQIGTQWASFFFIMFLFLIFTPRDVSTPPPAIDNSKPAAPTWREAVFVTAVSLLHFVVTFIASIIIEARFPEHLMLWANTLGIMSMILACVQYLPQIWTTWRLKHVGSLSIPMMCIQTPGGFIFALSLGLRLGWAGWSAWFVYIVLGSLQGCLLAMSLYYEYKIRQHGKDGSPEVAGESNGSIEHDHRDSDSPGDLIVDRPGQLQSKMSSDLRVLAGGRGFVGEEEPLLSNSSQ